MFHSTRTPLALGALVLVLGAAEAHAQEEPSAALEVTEIQLSNTLEDGQAADPGTSFSRTSGRIYAVVRLLNGTREETTVRVALEPADGPARSGVELSVPARPRYRTVARFSAGQPAGRYRVVVRDAAGEELSSVDLEITE